MEKVPESKIVVNNSVIYRIVKRIFDFFVSLIGLTLLLPLFLIVSIIIMIEDFGSPIFIQERNGLNGVVFRMYKFRSMIKNAHQLRASMESMNELDGPAFKVARDPRVTKVGQFIRKTSIDELPQLLNVLLGQMSIVGPRPLPTYETEKLNEYQKERLLVKPGLICYWQIRGRSNTSFERWMELDHEYIRDASLLTDLKIIFEAIPAVLNGSGAE